MYLVPISEHEVGEAGCCEAEGIFGSERHVGKNDVWTERYEDCREGAGDGPGEARGGLVQENKSYEEERKRYQPDSQRAEPEGRDEWRREGPISRRPRPIFQNHAACEIYKTAPREDGVPLGDSL